MLGRCGVLVAAAMLGCLCGVVTRGQTTAAVQGVQSQGKAQSIADKIVASEGLLDINMATAEELKALPGMGAAYAQRVIAGRPYSAKNQLVRRGILPVDEYAKIKESIIAHRVKN